MRAFAIGLASLVVAAPARADTQACVAAHVSVQEKRLAGDLRGAYDATENCVATDCPTALRAECTRWRDDLVIELPTIEVELKGAPAGAAIDLRIDGEPARPGAAVALNPGHHSVELSIAGKPTRRPIHLVEGQRAKLSIDLEAPAPPAAGPREASARVPIGPIVLGGVGVASLAVFAIVGGLGASEFSELEDRCAPHCTRADTDPVDTKLLVADVTLGIGAAALLGGAIWLLVDLTQGDESPVKATAQGLSVRF